MLLAIFEGVLGVILESLLWWGLAVMLTPLVWCVSLPLILVLAPFKSQPYDQAVADMFASVDYFWRKWVI